MGYAIGTVTGSGGDEAHYKVLAAIRTLALANGWTSLRYVSTGTDREVILQSSGLSTTEDIYIGFKTYHDVGADYYNIQVATFVGYLAGNSFESQPGYKASGVCCHNNAVTYFITANAQRITGCFKVGTPTYEHFYAGKMYVYGRPSEFPSPLVVAGMFNGPEARRYSDTMHHFPYYGSDVYSYYAPNEPSNLWLRDQSGVYIQAEAYPWFSGQTSMRPPGTSYQLQPIILSKYSLTQNRGNVFGELDGVSMLTGFNNSVENVLQQGGTFYNQTGHTVLESVNGIIANGGKAYVVLQDVSRNGFDNFIAMEMS